MKTLKTFSKNRSAKHEFTILSSLEVGLSLTSSEVKAIRQGKAQLKSSYVLIKEKSVELTNCNISRPEGINVNVKHDVLRNKILLLNKREIKKLYKEVKDPGCTLIITEIYQKQSSKIKATLCLVKGNTSYDKRHAIKEKQLKIEASREIR